MTGPKSSIVTRREMKVPKNPLASWMRLVAMISVPSCAPIDPAFPAPLRARTRKDHTESRSSWPTRHQRYMRLFDMQDEIVARLAGALNAHLVAAEARRAEQAPTPGLWSISRSRGRTFLCDRSH